MRVFEKIVVKRLLHPAQGRAHYAGKQPNASVEHHQRRRLAAGQDDVADRDLLDGACGEDALVETFETTAEDDDAGAGGEFADAGLGNGFAAGASWRG